MNNILNDNQNKRYRKKYKYMKIRIRSLLIENAALCDEIAKIQENMFIVKDERKFLLRKLLEYENEVETQTCYRNDNSASCNGPKSKQKKRRSLEESGKSNPMS